MGNIILLLCVFSCVASPMFYTVAPPLKTLKNPPKKIRKILGPNPSPPSKKSGRPKEAFKVVFSFENEKSTKK